MSNLHIIKELAPVKKTTIRKIAKVAGITEAGLHGAIERGDIKFSYLDKIANYLQVDISIFSDFPPPKKVEGGISMVGNNSGNIANGNIIHVSLPEEGTQKIIYPDGKIEIQKIASSQERLEDRTQKEILEKLELQELLISSLQDQVKMYQERFNKS